MHILWAEVLEKFKWELFVASIGIVLLAAGIWWWRSTPSQPERFQVLSAQDTALPKSASNSGSKQLIIDVSGSVIKPGVYSLSSGARVDDAIQLAGGLSSDADNNWVATNLNRAEKLQDGMKIFIPAKGVIEASITSSANNIISVSTKININSASADQLDSLKGIGPVTAQKIISSRPYAAIEDLQSKKIVTAKVFAQIKDQITAW